MALTGPLASGKSAVTVVRGAINGRTNVWQETSRHVIPSCLVAPGSSVEQTGTADVLQADVVVYAPFDADVVATDRVLIGSYPNTGDGADADVYDVNGRPVQWQSPFTSRKYGMVVALVVHT